MDKLRLGRTNLQVSRSGFGGIPIQRLSDEASTELLRAAFQGGIDYYDTARNYSSSEYKIGLALKQWRADITIATKTTAKKAAEMEVDLAKSLNELQSDYIDVYQFHNPDFMPHPGGSDGLYDAALAAKAAGKILYIGITNHRLALAVQAVKSGLYDVLQFPLSYLSTEQELALIELCVQYDVGLVAMKALAGGLISETKAAFSFLRQYDNVVPIWGLEKLEHLREFLTYENRELRLDEVQRQTISQDRQRLKGNYCRACGYCLPCPAGIDIPTAARMELLLGRSDWRSLISEKNQEKMQRVENCTTCLHCAQHCPYHLNTPELLKENLTFYREFLKNQGS